MLRFSRSHLADESLLRSAETHVGHERAGTADLLADLAEIDARKLYLPAGYPSLYAWCVGELHLCEQAAYKRILAARTARRFPALFAAVAEGRLHLSAVCLLASHLSEETADELQMAATHKTKPEIERLLADRFPQPDVLAWVQPIPQSSPTPPAEPPAPRPVGDQLSPGIVQAAPIPAPAPQPVGNQLSPGIVQAAPIPAPAPPGSANERARVRPLSPQRYAVQFTMTESAHVKLRQAQALLGHSVPSGDLAQIFERALDALVGQLEKAKLGATSRPRSRPRRSSADSRNIPADVRRAVWDRDQGRCTFVSSTGRRCDARKPLEFDHIEEFACGGEATVGGIRLRCRAHNQYQAERTFGVEFMRQKRLAAVDRRSVASVRGG